MMAAVRFIPAPAGNAPRQRARSAHRPVHPRACGEQEPSLQRGALTPVHPRACGEHRRIRRRRVQQVGSSPRLRGTHRPCQTSCQCRRFIPAPAGNTAADAELVAIAPVHPRACGEHSRRRLATPVQRPVHPRACGEQRRCCERSACGTPVHPRACGEHAVDSQQLTSRIAGSSPRLRGTGMRPATAPARRRFIPAPAGNGTSTAGLIADCRFIPAPAGNAVAIGASTRAESVHPRACGERRTRSPVDWISLGSSPRLRGTEERSDGVR